MLNVATAYSCNHGRVCAPSPTEGLGHRAEAEEFLFSFLLFSYEKKKKKKILYLSTTDYPQSIDVVYSDNRTYLNGYTYLHYHLVKCCYCVCQRIE